MWVRLSKFGSVEVTRYMVTERASKVMHLVSDVIGKLRQDQTALDALMAILPAGTLSGAPKVRAMELIDQFENRKRGLVRRHGRLSGIRRQHQHLHCDPHRAVHQR